MLDVSVTRTQKRRRTKMSDNSLSWITTVLQSMDEETTKPVNTNELTKSCGRRTTIV